MLTFDEKLLTEDAVRVYCTKHGYAMPKPGTDAYKKAEAATLNQIHDVRAKYGHYSKQ